MAAVKRWPRGPAKSIGAIAKAAGAGAVVVGFTIGVNTLHDASPMLDAASISPDRFTADRCTNDPADPTCPPRSPNDVKCTTATWHGSALCAGGPFDPNIVSPPICTPGFIGCPGGLPNTPPGPVPLTGPPSKTREPPPPPKSAPPVPEQPTPVQPPPVLDHPEPDTPRAPVAPPPSAEAPPAAVAPPPAAEAPPAPAAPAPTPEPSK